MLEDKSKRLFLVGAFVSAMTLLLVVSIFLVGGHQMLLINRYTLVAKFNDAQGLEVGSIVSLAGIQVGNVKAIKVHTEESSVILELSIDETYKGRITTGSTASIRTMGPLGDKYVYVEPGAPSMPLHAGDTIATSARKDFLEALEERSVDLKHLGDILKETSKLMSELNENDRTAMLIENLAATSKNLREITGKAETREALTSLAHILRKVNEGEGTLGRLVNDPALYERLMDLTGASSRNRFLKPLIRNTVESSPKQRAN